jgi:Transposase
VSQSLARRRACPQTPGPAGRPEADLRKVAKAVARKTKPLRGADKIGLAAGAVLNRHKVAKHFILTITDDTFGFDATPRPSRRGQARWLLCHPHQSRKTTLATSDVVRVYKSLSQAERAFRSIKTVDLEIRPIHHRLSDRVRAHVLLCMLAYYLEWHMRQALAPILFDDHQRAEAAAARSSIVAPAQRSKAARRKAATKRTADGLPVHSFQSLLAELATFTRNTMAMAGSARHVPALPATDTDTAPRLRTPRRAAQAVGSKSPPHPHYQAGSSLYVSSKVMGAKMWAPAHFSLAAARLGAIPCGCAAVIPTLRSEPRGA